MQRSIPANSYTDTRLYQPYAIVWFITHSWAMFSKQKNDSNFSGSFGAPLESVCFALVAHSLLCCRLLPIGNQWLIASFLLFFFHLRVGILRLDQIAQWLRRFFHFVSGGFLYTLVHLNFINQPPGYCAAPNTCRVGKVKQARGATVHQVTAWARAFVDYARLHAGDNLGDQLAKCLWIKT